MRADIDEIRKRNHCEFQLVLALDLGRHGVDQSQNGVLHGDQLAAGHGTGSVEHQRDFIIGIGQIGRGARRHFPVFVTQQRAEGQVGARRRLDVDLGAVAIDFQIREARVEIRIEKLLGDLVGFRIRERLALAGDRQRGRIHRLLELRLLGADRGEVERRAAGKQQRQHRQCHHHPVMAAFVAEKKLNQRPCHAKPPRQFAREGL
jgi:hypothetical protein